MSSLPHNLDDDSRPMPTRLLSSLKRPFSRPKNDHDRNPSIPPSRTTRGPIHRHREAPPNYQQIAMGLHLSRTPHLPARGLLPQLYPPATPVRRSVSSPPSSSQPQSHSRSRTHARRLPPPPARSALKKPTATSSSVTPDTASASTVASSVGPLTPVPTRSLLARFWGKERLQAAAVVVLPPERERERKAVRFGGLVEEDES